MRALLGPVQTRPDHALIEGSSHAYRSSATFADLRYADDSPDEPIWGSGRVVKSAGLTSSGSPEQPHCMLPSTGLDDSADCESDPDCGLETAGADDKLAVSDIGDPGKVEDEGGGANMCPRQKLQEKNRRAQQRFRARQKAKLAEKDSQIQDLVQQLSSLLDASNSLKSQNSVLTRMLELGQQRRTDEQQLSSGQHTQAQSMQQQPHAAAVLSPSLALTGSTGTSTAASGMTWQEGKLAGALTLTVKGGQPIQMTAEQVNTLQPDTLKILWKAYVNQLALSLMELEGGNGATAGARLAQLTQEACDLLLRFAAANPHGFKTLSACHLEDPSHGVAGDDWDIWLVVMRALVLTPKQKKDILQLRQAYLSSLKLILQQRAIHRIADSIKASLNEESGVLLKFVSGCCNTVFELVQTARMLVQSYPWLPDIVSISSWVAYELGDFEAIHKLSNQPAPPCPQLVHPNPSNILWDFPSSIDRGAGQLQEFHKGYSSQQL
ncbi:hypothetical protein WJX74_004153 [Apatococcus lobatus]|uniref:BZIP domain-containing protein n=1 Tax=Apatococcus lobatus TaxID=904363 RepID=A0AAW1SEJ8_9CHLO